MKPNVFQLIDFDRTLFNTTLLIEKVLDAIKRDHPLVSAELRQQSQAAYSEERTFLLFRYLREHYGDAWVEALVGTIVRECGVDAFRMPGADERLKAANELSSARPSWGILTYGDPIDQILKIHLAGLEDAPAHIVTAVDKGNLIASWKLPDGRFQLPVEFGGGIVDTLTFEDDKLHVFEGTPRALIGVWVTQRDDAEVRLAEFSQKNVVLARDLEESLTYLRSQLEA